MKASGEGVMGIVGAVVMAAVLISIGASTSTIISPAFFWGGVIALVLVIAVVLGLAK